MHTCFSSTHFLRVPVFSHQQVILRRQVIQGFMGTLWMEDPRDEAEFAHGHVFFFERNVVQALPTLLEEPVIFLSLASPRRDPEDITFVDPKDGTARTFMARNNESA